MKLALRFCLVSLYIFGCNSHAPNNNRDSLKNATIDTQRIQKQGHKGIDTAFEQFNSDAVLSAYYKGYKDTLSVDTSFDHDGKKVRISFIHYCTYDSALHLPGKYIEDYGLKEFTTHDFESKLKVWSGDNKAVDTIITKEMFKDDMYQEEKLYGVLLHPRLLFSNNRLIIAYSISIPLTDVGVSASLECDYDGKLVVRKNHQ